MTIATANRIIYCCCIVLQLSLLQIIGIASFQLGRNNPAFLCSSKSITNAQGPRCGVALSPLLAELSSTTMPAENEQQQQQQQEYQRHAIFQRTNAVSKSFPIPHADVWREFVTPDATNEDYRDKSFWKHLLSPAQLGANGQKQNQLVNDVTVQFDDAATGAKELVEKCQLFTQHNYGANCKQTALLPENTMMEQEITHHLTIVLSYFQSIAGDNNSNNIECQARIVSSRGRNGIKCPRWHADHVPVRLVMSIIGPGCEYIPHEVEVMGSGNTRLVDRNALNTLDEDDTRIANEIIVPTNLYTGKTIVTSAKEGDAVLLMGRAWEDSATLQEGDFTNSNNILAAVHRSPLLSPGQERILLTVDVVPPSQHVYY